MADFRDLFPSLVGDGPDLVLQNAAPATAAETVRRSAKLRFRGNVWNTTAPAASNKDDWFLESVPASGATPSGVLQVGQSLNGAGATYPFSLTSGGVLTLLGGIASGVGTVQPVGVLNSQFVPVSNTSIGSEDALLSYTLPANSLAVNGKGVRVTATGTFAANGNTKRALLYFGATLCVQTSSIIGAPNATAWRIVVEIVRTGAATQVVNAVAFVGPSASFTIASTPAETLSGAIVIKGAAVAATAATDVTQTLMLVEALP